MMIKEEMLCRLRRIARARSESELQAALSGLRTCDHFESGNYDRMVNYIEKQWIPLIEVCI